MKLGSIVTVLVDYPRGTIEEPRNYVKDEVGIVVEVSEKRWFAVAIKTQEIFPWWFHKDELRPATNAEIRRKLRSVMTK